MKEPPEEDAYSWLRPIYQEKATTPDLESYAVCKNCNEIRMNHSEGKCLFNSTMFVVKRSPVKK